MALVGCNCYFSFWAILSPFTLLTAQKMKKKKKKIRGGIIRGALTTSVPKIMITCYTVPEICCARDVTVIIHFGLIFAFLPLLPLPNSPKNENFKTMEKTPGDLIILLKCTKSHGHMLYCSWDIVHDRCNCYFSCWGIFCPLAARSPNPPPPLTDRKMKTSKKWKKNKKHLQISFYKSVPKIIIKYRTVSDIWCVTDVIIFSFGANFCPFTPITA